MCRVATADYKKIKFLWSLINIIDIMSLVTTYKSIITYCMSYNNVGGYWLLYASIFGCRRPKSSSNHPRINTYSKFVGHHWHCWSHRIPSGRCRWSQTQCSGDECDVTDRRWQGGLKSLGTGLSKCRKRSTLWCHYGKVIICHLQWGAIQNTHTYTYKHVCTLM